MMEIKPVSMDTSAYEKKVHLIGRVTLITGLLLTFLLPINLWLKFGILPPFKGLLNAFVSITSLMIPVSLVEILTFSTMMGASAMYIAYLTGNITNIKMPSAIIAMEVAEVEPSSKEGEIVSGIAMAGSVLACEIIIVLGVLLSVPLSVKLNNPVIQPAFQQILPALFGSLGAYYFLKDWKLSIIPLIIAILLSKFTKLPTAITIPICVFTSILVARVLYKKGLVE
ncbi:MAG: hypothetical protein NUV41_16185 [Eubacteriales bacterium]|jgi:hypothetical protein|nr:hypothetical protein [Eubacteriales bacterium]